MAYNKINRYKRIVRIQDIVKPLRFNVGLSYKQIYWEYIKPQFGISYRTFHTYMGIPARAELKKLGINMPKNKKKEKKELPLYFQIYKTTEK